MRSIAVTMNITLDGVVQGPGRPDEDTRDGFTHGGWGLLHQDEVLGREMANGMSKARSLLLGRRTWQDLHQSWGNRADGNPFSAHLDAVTKYVVSRKPSDPDAEWSNSVPVTGDAAHTVAELKRTDGDDLAIIGSTALVRALHAAGLIDDYTLVTHPMTLGSGARLFTESAPLTEFTLTDSVTTTTGVVVAHYHRVQGA